jgi:hypothetical protein
MGLKLAAGVFVTPTLRLERALGSGGMGHVWIAEHTGLRTFVVVKFISDELASNPEAIQRFSREAGAASHVKGPHVVHMIDFGIAAEGTPYIAMELLEGYDLGRRLEMTPVMPPREVATIVSHTAKALRRAHERGVVHRDIKPDNIFLSDGGGGEAFVKVLDFGVAKAADAQRLDSTKSGAMLGTPLYMSPEQVLGSKEIDHRTDLWSLGVVAFEALTGRRPFDATTIGGISIAICHGPIPRPSEANPTLSSEIDAWFARACARDVARRFASAQELTSAFERAVGVGVPIQLYEAEPDPTFDDEATRVQSAQEVRAARAKAGIPEVAGGMLAHVGAGTLPRAPGRQTTNGAVSQGPAKAAPTPAVTTAPTRKLPLPLVAVFVFGAMGVLGVIIGVAVATSGSRTQVEPESTRRAASKPTLEEPAPTKTTENESPQAALAAPVDAAPTSPAPSAASPPSATVTAPAPTASTLVPKTATAPPTATVAPPKPTASAAPPKPTATVKKKGSDEVIE